MVCVSLFIVANLAYWRMATLGELTDGMIVAYWLAAIVWAVKLEIDQRHERRHGVRRVR